MDRNVTVASLSGVVGRFIPPRLLLGWVISADRKGDGSDVEITIHLDDRLIGCGKPTTARLDIADDPGHLCGFQIDCTEDIPDEAAFERLHVEASKPGYTPLVLPILDRRQRSKLFSPDAREVIDIAADAKAVETASRYNIENGVLIGDGGELFLAHGAHHILDVVTGRRTVSDQTVSSFRRNLLRRQEAAFKGGAKYLHLINPDKQSVLLDRFPVKNPVCLGEVHLQRSPDLGQVTFYPLQLLRDAKGRVFRKTDTHMTDYGSAIVAAALAEYFTLEDQRDRLAEIEIRLTIKLEEEGDLGSKLKKPVRAKECFYLPSASARCYSNKLLGGNDGIADIYVSNGALYPQRVLWFGDSFGRNCVKILNFFFKEVVFLRSRFFHAEIFDQIKPDILITQNVERYLLECDSDDLRPSFFMYPHFGGRSYDPGDAFADAFSAVLSYPRQPYLDFVARQ